MSTPWKATRPFLYQIPATYRQDMRVPACFFSDSDFIKHLTDDRCIDQLINTATLPGVAKQVMAMPDMHQGYGFPIGGVVATRLTDGVISPGGVGYDINCGVRLLGTHLDRMDILPHLDDLAATIQYQCPSGVGQRGHIRLKAHELEEVLETGAIWALKRGFATAGDLEKTEAEGCLSGADPSVISPRAKERAKINSALWVREIISSNWMPLKRFSTPSQPNAWGSIRMPLSFKFIAVQEDWAIKSAATT